MRSLHSKNHKHRDEVIEAVNKDTGEVRHFANGKQCAEAIGCSSPAVYMTLDRSKTGNKATIKKWILKWTKDVNEDELSTIKKERSAVSRVLRRGKFDLRIKKLEDLVKHIEKSIKTREKKVRKMSKMSDRRKTTMSFIEHLKSKKRDIESKIEELVALKFKYTDENGNIMLENNNGDRK